MGVSITCCLLCCTVLIFKSLQRRHDKQLHEKQSDSSHDSHSTVISMSSVVNSGSKQSSSRSNDIVSPTTSDMKRVSSFMSVASHASDMQVLEDGGLVTAGMDGDNHNYTNPEMELQIENGSSHNNKIPGSPDPQSHGDFMIDDEDLEVDEIENQDTDIMNGDYDTFYAQEHGEQDGNEYEEEDQDQEILDGIVTLGGDIDNQQGAPPPPPVDTKGNDENVILGENEFVIGYETNGNLE